MRETSSVDRYGFVKFDVSGVSGTVVSATLRLYVLDPSGSDGSVYSVSNYYQGSSTLWEESTITWANAPSLTGSPLATESVSTANAWVEFDVTSAASGNGTFSFGLEMNSSDKVEYASQQHSNGNAPELVVSTSAGAPDVV